MQCFQVIYPTMKLWRFGKGEEGAEWGTACWWPNCRQLPRALKARNTCWWRSYPLKPCKSWHTPCIILPWKLTGPLKNSGWKTTFLLKWSLFGAVRFWNIYWGCRIALGKRFYDLTQLYHKWCFIGNSYVLIEHIELGKALPYLTQIYISRGMITIYI